MADILNIKTKKFGPRPKFIKEGPKPKFIKEGPKLLMIQNRGAKNLLKKDRT
jgi:hypothetical protein